MSSSTVLTKMLFLSKTLMQINRNKDDRAPKVFVKRKQPHLIQTYSVKRWSQTALALLDWTGATWQTSSTFLNSTEHLQPQYIHTLCFTMFSHTERHINHTLVYKVIHFSDKEVTRIQNNSLCKTVLSPNVWNSNCFSQADKYKHTLINTYTHSWRQQTFVMVIINSVFQATLNICVSLSDIFWSMNSRWMSLSKSPPETWARGWHRNC